MSRERSLTTALYWWHKYTPVTLPKTNRSLRGALVFSLALWIALLPFLSDVHMAQVPHVYCAEHGHFHEVVASGRVEPAEDTTPSNPSRVAQSSASMLASIEECPLCDLALRQGAVFSQRFIPALFGHLAHNTFQTYDIHTSWPVLHRAPKHSPPLQTV